MLTSRRSLAVTLILALVAALLALLPASDPEGPLGPVVATAAASEFPPMFGPLPPCGPDEGYGCPDTTVGVSVAGEFTQVGDVLVLDAAGGMPACNSFTDGQFSPSPCYSSVGISSGGCLHWDIWTKSFSSGSTGACGVSFRASTTTSTGATTECSGSGRFGTYVYGGPGDVSGAEWASYGPSLITGCRLEVVSGPSGYAYGPVWKRVSVGMSGWVDWTAREDINMKGDVWVPVATPVRNKGPIVECAGEYLGDNRYRFSVTDIDHPLGLGTDEIRWWFGTGDEGFDETVGSGSSVEFSFPTDGYSWVDWINVSVTDTDGVTTLCQADRPEAQPLLDVDLALADGVQLPVEVGEPFDVDLSVAAPASNDGDVLGITTESLVELPDFLELVEGALAGGFDLTPGQQQEATLTLRATEAGDGTVSSVWSGLSATAATITGTGELTVEAVGTLDGAWFRPDGLGEYVREGDTVDVRLRIENDTRRDLTGVTLRRAVVVPAPTAGEGSGAGDVASGDPPAPATCPEAPAPPDGEGSGTPGAGEDVPADVPAAELIGKGGSTLRGVLAATGIESIDFLDFTLEGVSPGDVLLCAEVAAIDPEGGDLRETIEATWEVKPQGLDVAIEVDLRREDGSAWELNTDNDGDGDVDEDDHVLPVEVVVTNTTDDDITDLSWLKEDEPVDWSNNLVGEDDGVPRLTFLGHRDELAAGDAGTGGFIPLARPIPDLAPNGEEGDSFAVTYYYEATGEVDADGQVVVLGAQGPTNVRGSDEVSVQIASGILLEFSAWLKEPNRLTTSGQVVRMGGYLENLDEDETDDSGAVVREARPIAVWITPLTDGNAGGGHLVARDGGRTPTGAEFIEVAPGERVELHGILATLASPMRTDAEVRYLVDAWQVPSVAGDSALPLDAGRIDVVVDEDKGWGDEHTQRLRFADLSPDDIKACETHLYDAIVTCNFYEGLRSLYFNTVDAARMAEQGIGEIGSSTYWVGSWAMHELGDVASALNDDPAAKQRLANELEVQLATWKQMGILGVDAGVSAVGVLDQFIAETDRVLEEGDTEAGLAWVSKFAGENPDLLFSAILKARTLTAMGQSALRDGTESAAGAIVRESMEAEARAAAREINQNVTEAINRAADPKMPSTGALRSGLDITDSPKVWRDVYGAARTDIDAFLQIAREEGIMIAFRSRSPISIQLLEDGLAWLKPQSVKAKNVNAIDVAYGGFPQDSLGRVVMVEPPIDFRLKGQALEDALDAHMAKLKRSHPELADDVWAAEVRDRIKMRTEKFDEHLGEWLDYAANGMPVGFEGAANSVKKGNLNVTELRDARIEVVKVPDPYNPGQQLTRIDLKIAGPDGGDYRHLSGDIDVVGFFNLDRSPIMGTAKRARIYEKMRGAGMQHGETLTWDHRKRAELLREHVGDDAELLVVAGPDGRLHLSALDETKSSEVLEGDNFAHTFSLLDGPPIELKSPNRPPGPPPSGALLRKVATSPRTIQAIERFKQPADIVDRLKKIAEQSGGQIVVEQQQSKDGPAVIVRPDGTMVIYRVPDGFRAASLTSPSSAPEVPGPGLRAAATGILAAPDTDPDAVAAQEAVRQVEALLGDYRRTFPRPAVGRLGGTWEEIDFTAAAGLGDPTRFEMPLTTWTDVPVERGDTTISVLQAEDLDVPGGDWFTTGDRVVFDPGGAYEQILTLTAVDGHRLAFGSTDALLPDEDAEIELPEGIQVLFLPEGSSGGGAPDGESPDGESPDSGSPDSGSPDSGSSDSGSPDSGSPDSGPSESGSPDSGSSDGTDADDDGTTGGGEVDGAPAVADGEVVGAPVVRGELTATGAPSGGTLAFALAMLGLGALLVRTESRRRRPPIG